MKGKPEDNIGEEYYDSISEKTSLIIHGKDSENPNTEEYKMLRDGNDVNITIVRDK